MGRIGTGLLWAGGIGLAALMAYTLALDLGRPTRRPRTGAAPDALDVAAFYPDREYWVEFRAGVAACADRHLLRIVEDGEDSLVVETPRHRRRVRFAFHDVRGLRETREAVSALARRPSPPLAVVGSSNTVLTVALAEALRGASGPDGRAGPVLLVPWASAVLVEPTEPGSGPVNLLDLYPGRTFRFCPNNQREADLAVDALAAREPDARPAKAEIVEDRRDPYSLDLSSAFRRAIERLAPDAAIVDRAEALDDGRPDPMDLPNASEDALAEEICREASARPAGGVLWVVLPLQGQPAGRMLRALARHARSPGAQSLRVICGDGLSPATLVDLAARAPFPVWCASFDAPFPLKGGVTSAGTAHVQVPAEIVASVVRCLDLPADRAATADGLRDALHALRVAPGDPAGLGRSIAFAPSGERRGEDLGQVLLIRPGSTSIFELRRDASGRWGPPAAVWPATAGGGR